MREEMISQGFRVFLESPKFYTIRAKFPTSNLVADFVLCRRESKSSDGRHPDFVEMGSILDDLSRRDFTINAIAKCLITGNLIDPHNGVMDLKQSTLRAVGDPEERFHEDGLRLIRALRFCVTKKLTIEPGTWTAIQNYNPARLASVSSDRRREELNKMFRHDPLKSMELIMAMPRPLQKAIFDGNIWVKATTES